MDDQMACFFCRAFFPAGALRMREDCTGDVAPACLDCWPGPLRKVGPCRKLSAEAITRAVERHVDPAWQEAALALWHPGRRQEV